MRDERERRAIWVFGSNLLGIHGGGAARIARDEYGAVRGVGVGRTGNAYAIPTMRAPGRDTLDLSEIETHINVFCEYAREHDDAFLVTRVGCGIAGFADEDVAPLFAAAPRNCIFAHAWQPFLPEWRA